MRRPLGSRSCCRCLAVVVCMAAVCRSPGSQLTSALGRRRSPRSRSGRDGGTHRDPNRCVFLKELWPDRAGESSAQPRGESAADSLAIWLVGAMFGVFSSRGRRAEWGKRQEFVFFAEVFYMVCGGDLGRGSRVRVFACEGDKLGHCDKVATGRPVAIRAVAGLRVRGYETESEVCPGVGTVVVVVGERRLTGLWCAPSLAPLFDTSWWYLMVV
ncbi:hypothetical protein Taro_008322, partial [Colocasia esculenta]|nr:hypothetical protein [Colocasia esculenta]